MGGAELRFTNLTITDPHDTWFMTHALGVISNAGPFSGTLQPASFSVSYNGTRFGSLAMPAISVIGNQDSPVDVEAKFTVLDAAVFAAMTKDLINSASITWVVEASVTLNALGLQFDAIEFSKELVIPAADGLRQVTLLQFDLSQSTDTEVIVDLEVAVQNPSIVSILPLGDLTFELYYEGAYVGMLVSWNASLAQGANRLRMAGQLAPHNMTVASDLFSRFLQDQSSLVAAVAAPNASSIRLFNAPLQGLTLQTLFTGITTPVVQDLAFSSLVMTPLDNTQVGLAGQATIRLNNPLGPRSNITVYTAAMDVVLSSGGMILGSLSTAPLPVTGGSQPVIGLDLSAVMAFHGDGTNFQYFVRNFLQSASVELTLTGTSDVYAQTALGTLNLVGIPVDLTVTLAGVSNFPSVQILGFDLPANSPGGGIELTLNCSLANPSIATVPIGTMVLDLYYGSARLGSVSGANVTLVPGANTLSLVGNISPAPSDLPAASQFFSRYVTGADSVVSVRGVSAGASPVAWVQQAVQAVQISTTFKGDAAGLIQGITLNSLGIFFPGGSGAPTASSSAVAHFNLPFAFPFSIWQMTSTLTISSGGTQFLRIPVPATPCTSDQAAGTLAFAFTRLPVTVLNTALFETFATSLTVNSDLTVDLSGVVSTTVATAAGNLTLSGVTFAASVPLKGFDSFLNPPISITKVDVVGGTSAGAQLAIDLQIVNPSIAYGDLGGMTLALYYLGEKVGTTTITDLSLPLGTLTLTGVSGLLLDNGAGSKSRQLLTNFLEGTSCAISLRGVSSTVTFLAPAISALSSLTTLPGLTTVLVPSAVIDTVGTIASLLTVAPTKLTINNPFTAGFTITATNFAISDSKGPVGTMVLSGLHIVVAGAGTTVTAAQDVSLAGISTAVASAFVQSISGGVELSIVGTMSITIGTFSTTASYAQSNVLATAG